MANLYDKTGRQIMRGDVLKVYHFTGARGKRHYMYKQATDTVMMLGINDKAPFLKIVHLNLTDDYYTELEDGRALEHYEIVQSVDAMFEDRPRKKPDLCNQLLSSQETL